MTDPAQPSKPTAAGRCARAGLNEGESAIATLGIALAAILLCMMIGSAWWAMRTQHEQIRHARHQDLRALGATLSRAAETMLARGEISSVRRLMVDGAQHHRLQVLRVVLPDQSVIAAAEPADINVAVLPETWPITGTASQLTENVQGARLELHYPLHIMGRGPAELVLAAETHQPLNSFWEAQAGVGVIGAVAMFALLLVYRYGRSRLAAMGAIREALLAVRSDDMAPGTLAVAENLGVEAQAWNQLLGEAERMRQTATMERTREALGRGRRGRSELDEACDAMPQGIILVDDQLRARYINGAAAVFLQVDRQKVIGADVRTLVKDEAAKGVLAGWPLAENRRRTVVECERRTEDDYLALRWIIRPVRREDSGAAMIVVEDVTQQRVADEARHAFVAQATHELRTPLTNIRLYVEMALEEGEQDPAVQAKCLNVINAESRRLERIVTDMLSAAEIEAGSLRLDRDDVRLEEVFRSLHTEYEAQACEKNIAFMLNLPPKLPVVQGDKDLILLAVHNLIGNAIKYTPENGTVHVNVSAAGDQVMVEVADSGIGISESDQQRIFEKFYRAQDKRISGIVGSGLGLALAREVVRLHGGDITVQSELDKGSTFTMTVPLHAAA